MISPAGINDGPSWRRPSIRSLAIVTGLPSWAGSRRTTASGRSSTSNPMIVRPSSVAIVTGSYPFLMTFDGSRIDSIRSLAAVSFPIAARSGPRVGAGASAFSLTWHLVHVRAGW